MDGRSQVNRRAGIADQLDRFLPAMHMPTRAARVEQFRNDNQQFVSYACGSLPCPEGLVDLVYRRQPPDELDLHILQECALDTSC